MSLTRRTYLGTVLLPLTVAGCLGGGTDAETPENTDQTATGETNSPADGSETPATVQVRSHPEYGDILVGSDGMTLYMFDQDSQGEQASTCYDSCAEAWPPLTVTAEPTKAEQVAAQLTTFERNDGETQVMAGGWPLYYFANDAEPGDTSGQGVNDVWWVLGPGGTPVKPSGTPTDGSSGY